MLHVVFWRICAKTTTYVCINYINFLPETYLWKIYKYLRAKSFLTKVIWNIFFSLYIVISKWHRWSFYCEIGVDLNFIYQWCPNNSQKCHQASWINLSIMLDIRDMTQDQIRYANLTFTLYYQLLNGGSNFKYNQFFKEVFSSVINNLAKFNLN